MRVLLALALTLCACAKQETHSSTEWPTAKQRVQFLCDYALCPTQPDDVAYVMNRTDEGLVIHAIVKLDPVLVPRWSDGCENRTLEARPAWVKDVLPKGWALKTAPDTWRCGTEKRVIHVKEGLILRSIRNKD